ncbi:hypothetical protein ACFT0G_06025 [Streptomyces sp. NPDC057020]|uniref:hypothetical protein n=1 Tax=unclassified Streptomyces TaxID=2593676 RepID=UPI00362A55F0
MSADTGPLDPFGPTYIDEKDAPRAPKDPEGDWWARYHGPDTLISPPPPTRPAPVTPPSTAVPVAPVAPPSTAAPVAPSPARPAPPPTPPAPTPVTKDDDQGDAEPGWVWTPGGWQWHGPTPTPPPIPAAPPKTQNPGVVMVEAALHQTGWHVNRIRWCITWASPALLGWGFGAIPSMTGWYYDVAANYSPAGGYVLSAGAVVIGGLISWRTRGWWPPLAWCLRAPLASAAFAALLYTPAALIHR